MNELDIVREKLKYANIQKVAKGAGVHPNVIYRIKDNKTNPTYATVKKIMDYMNAGEVDNG